MAKQSFAMVQHVERIVSGLLIGALAAAASYWLLFPSGVHVNLGRWESCYWLFLLAAFFGTWSLYRPKEKRKSAVEFDDRAGYWRLHLNMENDVCFATVHEQDKVPEPCRVEGRQIVGRIHCIIKDGFWVWSEET